MTHEQATPHPKGHHMTEPSNYDRAWSDLENCEWWDEREDDAERRDLRSRETLVSAVLAVADAQATTADQLRTTNEHLGTIAQSLNMLAATLRGIEERGLSVWP